MRGRRALAIAAVFAGGAVAGCGSDHSERHAVRDYIEAANRLEVGAAPSLRQADGVYRQFSKGKLPPDTAIADLATAEDAIRGLRRRVAQLRPPALARPLHRKLLRVLALNASMARESTELGIYLPNARRALAAVGPVNARLRRRLAHSKTPATQGLALTRYRRTLAAIVGRLDGLSPPPILAATHANQIRRLRTAERLARRLTAAVGVRDAPLVARLLLRFRAVNSSGPADRVLTSEEIRSYDARYGLITQADADVNREEIRLSRTLR